MLAVVSLCRHETVLDTRCPDEKGLFGQLRLGRNGSRLVRERTNVPGLATESATVEAMTRKLRALIPELLSLNVGAAAVEVPVELLWRKQELISVKPD